MKEGKTMTMPTSNYDDIIENINISNQISDEISKKREKGDVNVIVGREQYKLKTKNEFVILFYEALDTLLDTYKLSTMDLRVIICLLRKAKYGNLLSYSQSSIAKELNTKQPNISRSLKKLRECNILIKTEDNEEYLDPQVLTKGNLAKQQRRENHQTLKQYSLFDNY